MLRLVAGEKLVHVGCVGCLRLPVLLMTARVATTLLLLVLEEEIGH